MKSPISFFVQGEPKPAGSKRGFFIKKLNRVVITDANPNSKDWKTDVKHEAQRQYSGELWDCPIKLTLRFSQLRPKLHYRSGKNSHLLKESAPKRPTVKPDLLKLSRAVEDSLTGIIWTDDSLIVDEVLHKDYAEIPGVYIHIQEAE